MRDHAAVLVPAAVGALYCGNQHPCLNTMALQHRSAVASRTTAATFPCVPSPVPNQQVCKVKTHKSGILDAVAAQQLRATALAGSQWHRYTAASTRVLRIRCAATAEGEEDVMELEIKVGGMMCEGCTSRVTEALQKAPNVKRVEVSLEKSMASVEVKAPSPLEAYNMLPSLVETVKALGFEAEPHIEGLE